VSRKGKSGPPEPSGPFHNPFASLGKLKESLPEGSAPPAPVAAASAPKAAKGPARAVVRYERKGRGGKEATVVEQLGLPPKQLETWLKELKQRLGCGGVVEGDALVLQGDHRERLRELLTQRGVGKISVG
jgi:translation initiation factor 1